MAKALVEGLVFPKIQKHFAENAANDKAVCRVDMRMTIGCNGFVVSTPAGLIRCTYRPFRVERKVSE